MAKKFIKHLAGFFGALRVKKHYLSLQNQVHNAVIKPRFQELINRMRKKFDMPILDANQSISSNTNGISEIVDAEKLHGLTDKVIAVESVIFAARQFVQFQYLLRCRDNQLVNIYYSEVRLCLLLKDL